MLLPSEVLQKRMSDWQTFGKVRQNHYFSLPEISFLNPFMWDRRGKLTLSCGSLVGNIIMMSLSGGFNVVRFHAVSKDCQVWRQQELLPKEEFCRELFWDLPPSSLLFVPLWASPSLAALPLVCPWLGCQPNCCPSHTLPAHRYASSLCLATRQNVSVRIAQLRNWEFHTIQCLLSVTRIFFPIADL